ncbi:MAG: bacteriochlorophyll 4-vinyl reductase [Gemmobacter sp.]|uniref:bacteriochlorophyll 4-vinyl reductase n=1 Tax=Gemmobacter sp. TaxID=1898957 RepID=UPI0039194815
MNAPARNRIGPNAILQHLPVLDAAIGPRMRHALLHLAEVAEPPPDSGMIPQEDVARFHRFVRLYLPDKAEAVQHAAGLGTADYILAHRIPRPAQALIRALPRPLGARLLAAAIAKHAWTFAGTGTFRIAARRPLTFEIGRNPLAVPARAPGCTWHAAVFAGLFGALVWPGVTVVETACCGCGDRVCRFELHPR